MILGGLLAAALAGEPRLGRVEEGVTRDLGVITAEGRSWRVLEAHDHDEVRLTCKDPGAPPARRAVLVERGAVVLVEAPFPPALPAPGGWVLPSAGALSRTWAVDRPDCAPRVARVVPDPERYDRVEHEAEGVEELMWALGPHAPPWGPGRIETYAARRPSEGFWQIRRPLVPDPSTHARVEAGSWEGREAFRTDGPATWEVVGPARVDLAARALGPPASLCLVVDGDWSRPACVVSAPLEELAVQDGHPAATIPTHDGSPLGRLVRWRVLVPDGPHVLHLDQPAVTRAVQVDLDPQDVLGLDPKRAFVVADPDTWSLPRDAYRPRAPIGATVLFGPARWTALLPDAVSWLHPADVPEGTPWWTPDGRAAVVLDPTREGPCTVRFADGGTWTTTSPRGLHTFAWTGEAAPPVAPPTFEGCEGRVRIEGGPTQHPDRHVAVPLHVLEAGQAVAFDAPPGALWGVVLRAHPEEGVDEVEIELAGPTGPAVRVVLRPVTGGEIVQDADGVRWGAGADLGPLDAWLGTDLSTLRVRASRRVALRVLTEVEGLAAHTTASGTLGPAPSALAIARAEDDRTRGELLRQRGEARGAAGDARGGLSDLLLALALGSEGDLRAMQRAASDASRSVWAPSPAFVPVEETWLEAGLATPARLADAAVGHHVAVARSLGDDAHAIRHWLAAARTQTMTEQDVLTAWRAVLRSPAHPLADDPRLGALRAWSRTTTATAWVGTDGARWPQGPRPPEDLPFPEAWPVEQRAALAAGWRTGLTPLPSTVEARCLALDPLALLEPCEVRQLTSSGAELASWTLSPWGEGRVLDPAPVSGSVFTVQHAGRVRAELRAPGVASTWRPVRRLVEPTSTLDVAGPNVVEVRLARPEGGRARVMVEGTDPVELTLGPEVQAVPVPCGRMRCTLRVVAPPGTLLEATVLEAQTPGLQPPDHRALVLALARPVTAPPPSPELPAPGAPTAGTVLPDEGPPIALFAQVQVGVGGSVEEDAEAALFSPFRTSQSVGLLSRPTRAPWWIDVRAGAQEAPGLAALAEARAWTGWSWSRPAWRGFVSGDVTVRSTFRSDLPTTVRGRLDVVFGVRPTRVLDLRWRVGLRGAARDGPFVPDLAGERPQDALWSTYRDQHPLQGVLVMELRAFPTPWVRTSLYARGTTNAPGDPQPFDAAGGGLELRFLAPAFRAAIDLDLEARFIDAYRLGSFLSPGLAADLRGTLWPHEDVPVDLFARFTAQPAFRRFAADLGVELLFGRRAGLAERAAITYDGRFASAWNEPDAGVTLPVDR